MPSQYKALNDASRLAHAQLTGASPNPENTKSMTQTHGDLIEGIIQRWLGSTKLRLQKPQRNELSEMTRSDLIILSELDPDAPDAVSEAVQRGISLFRITRLFRRRKLALALADAEKRDVYDVVEHCMSEAELF